MTDLKDMPTRCHEIDGIRGFAALVVLLCHMIATPLGHIETILTPNFLFLNGTLAVQIFFVLSGDALSARYFQTDSLNVVDKLLLKRYFRLTFLILIASYSVYLLKIFGLDVHLEAARLTHNSLLAAYLPQMPIFDEMLLYSLVGVYVNYAFHSDAAFYSSLATAYNPVFWSMAIEMSGSLLVFLFLYIYPRLANPQIILPFLSGVFLLLFTSYAGFFFGIYIGYCRHRGWLLQWQNSPRWQTTSFVLLFCFLLSSGFYMGHIGRGATVLIAVVLVFLFYTNNRALRIFRARFARWLGEISFPLYAIHFSILISLTSWLIIMATKSDALTPVVMAAISLVSIFASLLTAVALHKLEKPYLKSLDYLASYCLSRQPAEQQSAK